MATHVTCDVCDELIEKPVAVLQFQQQGDPQPWDLCFDCVNKLRGYRRHLQEQRNGQVSERVAS